MGQAVDDRSKFLRQRAEEALRGSFVDLEGLRTEDIQTLIHELQVHQVELTLQNEELRRVQQELEEARDQYSDLYNYAPAGYCTLSRKDQILEANNTLADLFGILQADLLDRKLSDFVRSDDQDRYYLHRQHAFIEGSDVSEIRIAKRTGELAWVRLDSRVDHNDPTRLRVILSDITGQKQAEGQLQENADELKRLNRELTDFTSIASHDLQEPLRKIRTFGDRLLNRTSKGQPFGEQEQDYIKRMQDAAQRMQTMIDGLLALSRLAVKGQQHILVDLSQITGEVLSDLEPLIERSGGEVEVNGLGAIEADPILMRQLLLNLIGNALKFTKPGVPPRVGISQKTHPPGDSGAEFVDIYVQDHGIGMDMTHAKRLFQPFFRMVGRSEYEGNGIGLAICHKIVEQHGGSISVESKPGEGSLFIVSLPVKQNIDPPSEG